MKRYLDPKNDLVFKRVFGEHPEVLRAFLNEVLPLKADEKIQSLEYLSPEQAPEIPVLKHSIVDVRCKDQKGRQFIVEMQMEWTISFKQRVYFNTCKAYVRQLGRGEKYELLQPVFGLSLVNDIFEKETPEFYHHYKTVNVKDIEKEIEGLQFVFIELPKFHYDDQKPGLGAWLRYLCETGEQERAPIELADYGPEMKSALDLAEEAAYSTDDLIAYDRYWDAVSTEKTLISGKLEEGFRRGRAQGREEGRQEGREEGLEKGLKMALQKMVDSGITEENARTILGIRSVTQ